MFAIMPVSQLYLQQVPQFRGHLLNRFGPRF